MIKRHTMIYKDGTSKPKLLRSVICHVLLRKIASFITTYVSTDRDNALETRRRTLLLPSFLVFRRQMRAAPPRILANPTRASLFTFSPSRPLQLFYDPQFVFLTCPDTVHPNFLTTPFPATLFLSFFPHRRKERIIWHRDDCHDDEAFRSGLPPKRIRTPRG